MPLPQPRVDLHQLEAAVARIALELDLRQAVVAECLEEPQRRVDGLLHPDSFAHAAGADARRGLAQLPSREDSERKTRSRQVAADGVERVVSAGNQLLHHRSELLGARVGLRDLVERRAAKRLFAETLFEADRVLGLDEHRQAELLGRAAGLLRRTGIVRAGRVDACERCRVELLALALHALEQVPRGKGSKELQVAEMLRDQVELAIVRWKDDDLAERTDRGDEPLRVRAGISAQKRLGVARAKPERARTMVDGENADASAAERANRREPVDPANVDYCSRHVRPVGCAWH